MPLLAFKLGDHIGQTDKQTNKEKQTRTITRSLLK